MRTLQLLLQQWRHGPHPRLVTGQGTRFKPAQGRRQAAQAHGIAAAGQPMGQVSHLGAVACVDRFEQGLALLRQAIGGVRPDAVLCLGQAAGRAGLTPERVAINIDDAHIPDNAGDQPIDRPVVDQGPAAYFSTLPVKAMAAAMDAVGVPASVSNTAGTYVCNHVMYSLLHELATVYPGVRGGFMHVPMLAEQAEAYHPPLPGMSADEMARGIRAAIAAIADNRHDIAASAGREH